MVAVAAAVGDVEAFTFIDAVAHWFCCWCCGKRWLAMDVATMFLFDWYDDITNGGVGAIWLI